MEISQNSQENTCARVSFFNKVAPLRPGSLFQKDTLAQVFSCEFGENFKNTFFVEHLWWKLLNWLSRFCWHDFHISFKHPAYFSTVNFDVNPSVLAQILLLLFTTGGEDLHCLLVLLASAFCLPGCISLQKVLSIMEPLSSANTLFINTWFGKVFIFTFILRIGSGCGGGEEGMFVMLIPFKVVGTRGQPVKETVVWLVVSSNINEVSRAVLNFSFFYKKILQAQKLQ